MLRRQLTPSSIRPAAAEVFVVIKRLFERRGGFKQRLDRPERHVAHSEESWILICTLTSGQARIGSTLYLYGRGSIMCTGP